MTRFNPNSSKTCIFCALTVAILLTICCPAPVKALQQLQYPTFTADWDDLTPIGARALTPFARLTSGGITCWQGYFNSGTGGPDTKSGDGYIELPFPAYAKASQTNILIGYSRYVDTNANSDWSCSLIGNILDQSNPNTSYGKFLDFIASATNDIPVIDWAAASWTGTLEAIPSANSRLCRIKWNIVNTANNKFTEGRVRDIYLHMSPCGLAVTEESGGFKLTWHESREGLSPGGKPLKDYRIYRRTDPAASWDLLTTIASNTLADPANPEWLDDLATLPPDTETVYYCVSDRDSTNYESPQSPVAVFKPAKLVIYEVSSQPDVNVGQTVLVYVNVINTGYSALNLNHLALEFEGPASAVYNILASPTFPVLISGEASTTLEFQVQIDKDLSAPGLEMIDANGLASSTERGTNLSDTEATIKQPWTIRAPANLKVTAVTVPENVFRGQTGAPIDITVFNDGGENAAGLWYASQFVFDPGASDFTNLRLAVSGALPVEISADNYATVRYLADVKDTAATGTCWIESRVEYSDINVPDNKIWTNWMDSPLASWTVRAGMLKTYRNDLYNFPVTSYNVGDFKVYAKAENLEPLTSHIFRWFDASGTEVLTSPPVSTDDLGARTFEYQLTGSSKLGVWRVAVTKPLRTIPLAENYFWVVEPASIAIDVSLPEYVVTGRPFTAYMTMTNLGGAAVDPAFAGELYEIATNTGTAVMDPAGVSPATQIIDGYGVGTFTWQFTAGTTGSYAIEGKGYAYDANNGAPLETASKTSNTCIIQTAPDLSVTGVSESYTTVSPGQANLSVNMGIRNDGDAAVYVDAASLTFDFGTHTQTYASPPVYPFLLQGHSVSTIVFYVAVDVNSATGTANATGSFSAYEAYAPEYTYGITHGGTTGSWEIADQPYGECSANGTFNPQQYQFNQGQTMFVRFLNPLPPLYKKPNEPYNRAILFFASETPGAIGAAAYTVRDLDPVAVIETTFPIPGNATITKWCAVLYNMNNNTIVEPPLCIQNFWVQRQGTLNATMTITPYEVASGSNITVTMTVANEPADNSTISPVTVSLPEALPGSVGSATRFSGPIPESAAILPGYPATFTWVYTTTGYSAFSSFQMTATATGIDINTTSAATVRTVATATISSPPIKIYAYAVDMGTDTIDLGTMLPGETKIIDGLVLPDMKVTNNGNATMTSNMRWQRLRLESAEENDIPLEYFSFSPDSLFTLNAPGSRLASLTLTMPYNQASGTYEKVMRVFGDLNGDTERNTGEPYDEFLVRVIASECRVITVTPEFVDLGGCYLGENTSSRTISIFSGGNLGLDQVKFKEISSEALNSSITVDPGFIGSLTVAFVSDAEVSIAVGATQATGTFLATWTVWDDRDLSGGDPDAGEASATFLLQVKVGTKGFVVTPDPLEFGAGDPGAIIANIPLTIDNNIGRDLDIVTPAATIGDLTHTTNSSYKISADDIVLQLPTESVPSGETRLATISIFLPSSRLAGDYTGTITFYDADDQDGFKFDLTASVTINPFYALDVLTDTAQLGGMLSPGTKEVGFKCLNIGSADITDLDWTKVDLTPIGIYTTDYEFTPAIPDTDIPCGQILNATVTMTLTDPDLAGEYKGLCRLWDSDSNASDSFYVGCQIGAMDLEIFEAGPLPMTGIPDTMSSQATFTVKNIGSLTLDLVKATATADLVHTTLPANVITPDNAAFSSFAPIYANLSREGNIQIFIPAGTEAGTYEGIEVLKAWNDSTTNGIPDEKEASDTVSVSLTVAANKSIVVSPTPVEPPVTAPAFTGKTAFLIRNTGNQEITSISITPRRLLSGTVEIPANKISYTFSASPLNYKPVESSYMTATVTVEVPAGQMTGIYSGQQSIEYDGIAATFTLRIVVGNKKITVTDPVAMGSGNPESYLSKSFTVKNDSEATIILSNVRWLKSDLTSGLNSIAASAFSFSPTGFSLGSGMSTAVTASMTIPSYQLEGTYSGLQTVFDDQNYNLQYDEGEASTTFTLSVTVNRYPKVDILTPSPLYLGEIAAGGTSSNFSVSYRNVGNVDLNLEWKLADMSGPGDPLLAAEISFVPSSFNLLRGETGNGTVTISPAADRAVGFYSGTQTLWDSSESIPYPAHIDTIELQCDVVETSGPELEEGSAFQEVATLTWTPAGATWIMSAWVSLDPVSSAAISLYEIDGAGISTKRGIEIDANGGITPFGAVTGSGVVMSNRTNNPPMTWHRVYFSFIGPDIAVASNTYMVLQNTTENTAASQSVWFDGVQLERAASGQTRPAPYTSGKILVSPNRAQSLEGKYRYNEW